MINNCLFVLWWTCCFRILSMLLCVCVCVSSDHHHYPIPTVDYIRWPLEDSLGRTPNKVTRIWLQIITCTTAVTTTTTATEANNINKTALKCCAIGVVATKPSIVKIRLEILLVYYIHLVCNDSNAIPKTLKLLCKLVDTFEWNVSLDGLHAYLQRFLQIEFTNCAKIYCAPYVHYIQRCRFNDRGHSLKSSDSLEWTWILWNLVLSTKSKAKQSKEKTNLQKVDNQQPQNEHSHK